MNERKKRPRKPKEEENQPGRYDQRNTLNDLTGKEWLLLTKSHWLTEPSPEDKAAYEHPAPFLFKDASKLISLFTKKGMTVLDPFAGSGTTLLAASRLERKAVGIDINPDYRELFIRRTSMFDNQNCRYIIGDSLVELSDVSPVDYILTSPPYHNILRNKTKGTRANNGKLYRMSAREGIEYYSDHENDLGNFEEYRDFLRALSLILSKSFEILRPKKYCTIIASDFTVNKKEVCFQADLVNLMINIGFEFVGTTVLLQPVKPLYPFGYPYAYKINHHHQNIMTFRKPIALDNK